MYAGNTSEVFRAGVYTDSYGDNPATNVNVKLTDKKFSDAWWLCTNETMIVRDLFDRNVRSNFMKYLNRNYQITGQGNMLIIITEKPLLANDYPRVINDMRAIQRFLKNNKKFYTQPRS